MLNKKFLTGLAVALLSVIFIASVAHASGSSLTPPAYEAYMMGALTYGNTSSQQYAGAVTCKPDIRGLQARQQINLFQIGLLNNYKMYNGIVMMKDPDNAFAALFFINISQMGGYQEKISLPLDHSYVVGVRPWHRYGLLDYNSIYVWIHDTKTEETWGRTYTLSASEQISNVGVQLYQDRGVMTHAKIYNFSALNQNLTNVDLPGTASWITDKSPQARLMILKFVVYKDFNGKANSQADIEIYGPWRWSTRSCTSPTTWPASISAPTWSTWPRTCSGRTLAAAAGSAFTSTSRTSASTRTGPSPTASSSTSWSPTR
jgi:hypothetical protein